MSRNRRLALGAAAAAVMLVVAVGGWYGFIRGDAPPPVSLERAVASLATPSATAAGGTAAAPNAGVTSTTPAGTATADASPSLIGDWRIAAGSESFVGYRIVEELANIGANTAVGRTADVSGSLSYDGSAVTVVQIEANLQTLSSDDSRRDDRVRSQSLRTDVFPTATFTLTEPIALAEEPAAGATITVTAAGQLTLLGVTRDLSIPLEGTLTGGRVVVVGAVEVVLADYGIAPPTAPLVLSIEESGTLEFQLIFEPA